MTTQKGKRKNVEKIKEMTTKQEQKMNNTAKKIRLIRTNQNEKKKK